MTVNLPGLLQVMKIKPVSYTHLDVYKRQVYLDEKIERYIVDIVFATRFPEKYDLKELKDMIGFGAVSYTHLDVYKRQ